MEGGNPILSWDHFMGNLFSNTAVPGGGVCVDRESSLVRVKRRARKKGKTAVLGESNSKARNGLVRQIDWRDSLKNESSSC